MNRLFARRDRTAALALVTALVLTLATSAAVVFAFQRPDGGAVPKGVSILEETSASPGLTVDNISATAFNTTDQFAIELDEPLKDGEAPVLDLSDLSIPGFAVEGIEYAVAPGRSRALFTLTGNALPAETRSVDISLRAYYVIPPDGDGVRHEGPWQARVTIAPGKAGTPQAATAKATLETGYGWRYVVDSVEFDATAVRLRYHVEGDTDGLRPLPPTALTGDMAASFPGDGSGREELLADRPRSGSAAIFSFAGALRPVTVPATATFERKVGAWASASLAIGGQSLAAQIVETSQGGVPYISVRVDLNPATGLMLNGSGSPGQNARLVDDLGNSYRLEHGSANYPPTGSSWDFAGPVATGATRLVFMIGGYGVIEDGEWEFSVPTP